MGIIILSETIMKAQTTIAHALVFALLLLESFGADTAAISPYRNQMLNNMYIQKFLCPSAFVGLLLAISFFAMCLMGLYMLMSIQAPIFFHQQKVNWGKVDHDS